MCRQQVADLAKYVDSFAKNNGQLIIIGSGNVSHINKFKEITGYRGTILTDPCRETFRLLGFTSGFGGILSLKTISKGFLALKHGVKPGSLQGSILQLGGAIIMTPEENVLYFFKSSNAGDDPPVDEMLASLTRPESS